MKRTTALLSLSLLVGSCNHKPTYAEGCGPLPKDWITPRQGRSVLSMLNIISVASDGSLTFNGVKSSRPVLAHYLKQTGNLNPIPVTQIKFASTVDCDTVESLRHLMASTLDCQYGKCAEGNGKWWFIGDVVFDGQAPEAYDPDSPPSPIGNQQRAERP